VQPLHLAVRLGDLAGFYDELDQLNEAESAYREALAIKTQLLQPDDRSLAITLSNLAHVHWKRKHFPEAEPLILPPTQIHRAVHGERSAVYGPGVRCKQDVTDLERLVSLICIRPFERSLLLLAIMDIRTHPILFAARP